jgi:hypothetical protein
LKGIPKAFDWEKLQEDTGGIVKEFQSSPAFIVRLKEALVAEARYRITNHRDFEEMITSLAKSIAADPGFRQKLISAISTALSDKLESRLLGWDD